MAESTQYVRWFEDLGSGEVATVGGKNASLGEMIRSLEGQGIRVPGGFTTTAGAYREFLRRNDMEERLRAELDALRKAKGRWSRLARP